MAEKIFLNKKNQALPYSLNALRVQHFQGIKYLEIADLPCDAQWIFLTGENGFGKTSVLRAIAKSTFYTPDTLGLMPTENNERMFSWHYDRNGELKSSIGLYILAYGISRFNLSKNQDADIDSTASLFTENAILESIEQEIKDYWYEEQSTRFQTIKTLLCTIIPALENIKVEYDKKSDRKQVFYTEKGGDGSFQDVSFNELATGYRNIIAMIGDMMIRLRRIQHESIAKEDFKNFEGIVIIDEFDAHLHPKYQYELPKLLSDVFPKVQFIVSTHSPIPLLGAPKDSAVVLKVNRTAAEGITIERMDEKIPFDHLQPNALLTSPIFGFADLFPRRPASEVLVSHHWQDIQEDFNLQKELDELKEEGLL